MRAWTTASGSDSRSRKWRRRPPVVTQSCRGTRRCRVVAANELVPSDHSGNFRHATKAIAKRSTSATLSDLRYGLVGLSR
jgi:hypothetical protein